MEYIRRVLTLDLGVFSTETVSNITLRRMGHKPSLLKAIGHFSNFSLGFNSVSVFASISLAYGYGLNFGGPVTMVWGWLVTFFFSVLVTLSLAEIASVYPIAGSVFHWSGLLTPKEDSAIACYICGWMSFLCNSSCDAAFAFAATQFFNAAITADGNIQFELYEIVIISIAFLTIWTIINFMKIDTIGNISKIGASFTILSIFLSIVIMLSLAPSMNTTHHVFFHYESYSSLPDRFYVVCMSILLPIFAFAGYDSNAHLAEETRKSIKIVPYQMLYVTIICGVFGFCYLISLIYVTTSVKEAYNAYCDEAVINVYLLTCGFKVGNFLVWMLVVNFFIAGMSSVTVTGRVTFALLREKILPFSDYWTEVHSETKAPIKALIFVYLFDIILLCIPLFSQRTFESIVGISSVSYNLSYSMPILIKVLYHRNNFEKDKVKAIDLGPFSTFINIISLIWLYATSFLLCMPRYDPVTINTFNWTPVVIAVVVIIAGIYWIYYARYHFIGPAEKMDAERQALLASIEVSSDEEDDDEFNYEGSDGFSGSRTPFFSPPATSYPTALNTPYNRSRSNSPPTGVSIAPSPIKVQIQRSAWPSTSSQSSSDNRQGGSISRFSPEGSIDSYNDNDNDSSDLFTSAFDRSSSKSQTLTNESGRPPRPKSQQTSSNPSPIKSILKKERNQSVDSSKTDSQDDDKQSSKQQQSDQNEYEDVGSDVFSSILEERYER